MTKPCEKSGNERCASCKRACSCWSFTGFGRADDSCRGPMTVQKSGGRRELPKSQSRTSFYFRIFKQYSSPPIYPHIKHPSNQSQGQGILCQPEGERAWAVLLRSSTTGWTIGSFQGYTCQSVAAASASTFAAICCEISISGLIPLDR